MHFKFKRNKIKCSKYWSKLFLYLETLRFVFPCFLISLKISTFHDPHLLLRRFFLEIIWWWHTGTCWANDKMDLDTSYAQEGFNMPTDVYLELNILLKTGADVDYRQKSFLPQVTWHMKVTKKAVVCDVLSEAKQKMRWGRCCDVTSSSILMQIIPHNTQLLLSPILLSSAKLPSF